MNNPSPGKYIGRKEGRQVRGMKERSERRKEGVYSYDYKQAMTYLCPEEQRDESICLTDHLGTYSGAQSFFTL